MELDRPTIRLCTISKMFASIAAKQNTSPRTTYRPRTFLRNHTPKIYGLFPHVVLVTTSVLRTMNTSELP